MHLGGAALWRRGSHRPVAAIDRHFQGYYFFNAAPYILTLIIMIISAGSKSSARDVPGELSITK